MSSMPPSRTATHVVSSAGDGEHDTGVDRIGLFPRVQEHACFSLFFF
jgi:hypothetical protein